MTVNTFTITHEIQDWEAEILAQLVQTPQDDGSFVATLPPVRLQQAQYHRLANTMTLLGGRWNKVKQGFVYPGDASFDDRLQEALETGTVVIPDTIHFSYTTPPELAQRMVGLVVAHYQDFPHPKGPEYRPIVLEPSAGHGKLVDVILEYGYRAWVVEKVASSVEVLRFKYQNQIAAKDVRVFPADFEEWAKQYQAKADDGTIRVDAVVMHPPWNAGQDLIHVQAAWKYLRVDGIMLAVVSKGWIESDKPHHTEFRGWLAQIGAQGEHIVADDLGSEGMLLQIVKRSD